HVPRISSSIRRCLGHELNESGRNQAAALVCRIFHDRSRLRRACSSGSRSMSRARTTRKCRGRKSSIVLPSRYWSITAGLTYELRATAGVLPRDRKSTRLNSSHVEISYAVFCLRKKNDQSRLDSESPCC